MSENRNRGISDFSKYDMMATEELEEILRLDAESMEDEESDTELLLYVMGVLADRRRNNGHTGKTALEAYESFKQNYLPEVDDIQITSEIGNRPKVKPLRWLRGLTAAAAVLAIVLLGTVTADAFGFDIWEVVAKWTKETFHFSSNGQEEQSEPSPSKHLQYTSLQDVLDAAGIDANLVPTWIPDGFELVDIRTDETPIQKTYIARYDSKERSIKIVVRSGLETDLEQIERSDGFLEIYKSAGNIYYIFTDNQQMRAVWIKNSYECYITGELTVEEIKMMIDSIEKG